MGAGERSAHPPHVTENDEEEDPEEDGYDPGADKDHDLHAASVLGACVGRNSREQRVRPKKPPGAGTGAGGGGSEADLPRPRWPRS